MYDKEERLIAQRNRRFPLGDNHKAIHDCHDGSFNDNFLEYSHGYPFSQLFYTTGKVVSMCSLPIEGLNTSSLAGLTYRVWK